MSQNKGSKIKSVFLSSYCKYGNCLETSLKSQNYRAKSCTINWVKSPTDFKENADWIGIEKGLQALIKHGFSGKGAMLIGSLQDQKLEPASNEGDLMEHVPISPLGILFYYSLRRSTHSAHSPHITPPLVWMTGIICQIKIYIISTDMLMG